MLLIVILIAFGAILMGLAIRDRLKPPYEIYVQKDLTYGKLKIGICRVKAKTFPTTARDEASNSFELYNWTPSAKYLRTAYLDPEADDVDEALAEAMGKARNLIEQWSRPAPLDELHAQATRMLKR